jgi:hypothetical protein
MGTMKKILFPIIISVALFSLFAVQKPGPLFITSANCVACHNQLSGFQGKDISIGSDWEGSMMANSARDPYWQAAIRREALIHPNASPAIQNECAGCHMPMTRTMAKVQGILADVFGHFPITPNDAPNHDLASDGVSCTMCHQIKGDKLGTRESFTAGYVVDRTTPMGKRKIFGPVEVDPGRQHLMQSASQFVPQKATHIETSEFCASCHTLFTHTLNDKGEVIGILPEQVPYLEWKHSNFAESKNCQSCHMPLENQVKISSVLGIVREQMHLHVFRGGNFLIPRMLNSHRSELGVKALPQSLLAASERSANHLETNSAVMEIDSIKESDGMLQVEIRVLNLAGHKLPTAYPSRRVWLHLKITDHADRIIFESGKWNPNGSIAGNDNDCDKNCFEPHYNRITQPDQVQIYEAIMVDENDRVTTALLSGIRYIKDNRLLPKGFDKQTAHKDCGVYGTAEQDPDFQESGDRISYHIPVSSSAEPMTIEVDLYYQPIGYRWAMNLEEHPSRESGRFISYYRNLAGSSAIILTRQSCSIR